jgi:hypothetical protein
MTTRNSYLATQQYDDSRLFEWQTLIVICRGLPALR